MITQFLHVKIDCQDGLNPVYLKVQDNNALIQQSMKELKKKNQLK